MFDLYSCSFFALGLAYLCVRRRELRDHLAREFEREPVTNAEFSLHVSPPSGAGGFSDRQHFSGEIVRA